MGRYQVVLTPCEATNMDSWHKVIASADKILDLWEQFSWRGNLSWNQQFIVQDTKKGVTMTEQEYTNLVNQLKGW